MTEKEYKQVMQEAADRVRRTSFPALPRETARQQFEARKAHAEYGESRH